MQIGLYILIDGYLHYHKSYLEQYNSFNVHFETNTTIWRLYIYSGYLQTQRSPIGSAAKAR